MLTFTVPLTMKSINLKTFLAQQHVSATAYKKLKYAGLCSVNAQVTHTNALLQPGDRVTLTLPPEATTLEPLAGDLAIIYEDEHMLVVNKPAGLLTHPTVKESKSLANIVAWYYQKNEQPCGMHPVSRLDKETSGLVIFAKNSLAHHLLTEQKILKEYLGLVQGVPTPPVGTIAAPLARKNGSIIEREVNYLTGQTAITDYEVLGSKDEIALVHFLLHTGRTHQIRVHCAYLGHPLLGDNLYGTPGPPSRHLLHAARLTLTKPFTNEKLVFSSPLPTDMCYNIATKNF